MLVALVAVARFVPDSRSSESRPLDWPGAALSSAGLAALTFGVIRAGENGWGDPLAWVCLAAARCSPSRSSVGSVAQPTH